MANHYREATLERELWPRLYHLVMEVGETLRLSDVTFPPPLILLVFFWAALHDRPVCWACKERNGTTTTLHPATLPRTATMSRRLRRVDTALLLRAVVATVREQGDQTLLAILDGKPLPVGGARGDPEARCGRGAGMLAQGYKLLAVWGGRPAPEAFRVYPRNKSEDSVAVEMMPELQGGGYLLGDGV